MEGGGVGSMSGQSPGTWRSCTWGWQDRPGAHEPGLHMWPVKRRCLALKQTYQCQAARKGGQVRSTWADRFGALAQPQQRFNLVQKRLRVWTWYLSTYSVFLVTTVKYIHCACGLIYSLRKRTTEQHCKCKGSQRMQHTAGPFGQKCLLSTYFVQPRDSSILPGMGRL